jgi:hypothetical protein
MESLDDRAQRIQDRLRDAGDDEAAELIDELYGLLHEAQERQPVVDELPTKAPFPPPKRTAVLKESPWWVDQDKLPKDWPRLPVQSKPSS